MSKPRSPIYAPWKKGPADVVTFPHPPRRAIYVERSDAGISPIEEFWIALATDCDGEIMFRTESGPLDLVINAVVNRRVRRGLPIVIVKGGQNG